MTNCYKHCEHFFNGCNNCDIHRDVLISYWMMAGYLGAIDSVDEAYRKGNQILWDLIQKRTLKPSHQDPEMIEFVRWPPNSKAVECRHEGSCVVGGFVDFVDLIQFQKVVLTDGMLKKRSSICGDYLSRQVVCSRGGRGLQYLAHFNPTPNSLKLLLEDVNQNQPSMLLFRGCELLPHSDFSFERFKTLTALEISGSGILANFPIQPISKLYQLRYLHVSDPLIVEFPDNLCLQLQELRWLIFRGCSRLSRIPHIRNSRKLEVLDVSGCEKLMDLPEDLTRLGSLKELYLSGTKVNLASLGKLSLRVMPEPKWDANFQLEQGAISKPVAIHIISPLDNQLSVFDRFVYEFAWLDAAISDLANKNIQAFKWQYELLPFDLKYILENVDRLQSSGNWESNEKLLQELMEAIAHLSATHFTEDSPILKLLFRAVVKLKILLPTNQAKNRKPPLEISKKKQNPMFMFGNMDNEGSSIAIDKELSSVECLSQATAGLLCSYQSLTNIQKCCLLCFSVFPCNEDAKGVLKSLVIKKKVLVYWWVGEGFIDTHCDLEKIVVTNLDTNNSISSLEDKEEETQFPQHLPAQDKKKTNEEIGMQMLKVLTEKGFIETVMKKGRKSRSCRMLPSVHSFVTELATKAGYLDFNQKNGKLSTRFTLSQRACLLKSQDNVPSSCNLWSQYTNSEKMLSRFKTVQALVNVNEPMIDIKPEWFSKMKYLSVLSLGTWRSEYEEVEHMELLDQKFLEDLRSMRKLRFFSLQGLSAIPKLPDSICMLTNLLILDLGYCHHLEELPAGIGSLKNLTHLDITKCRFLNELPKGIKLLSKLEVLKGFVITYLGGCLQNEKACSLRDLLKLGSLRKLSIVVNVEKFPEPKDIQVFMEMKSLRKLNISWENCSCHKNQDDPKEEVDTTTNQKVPGASTWQKMKIWKSQTNHKIMSTSNHLDNIEKLVLWFYPYAKSPYWLDPSILKKLKVMYIMGGKLAQLGECSNEGKWNVTTLRLKYLLEFQIDWPEFEQMFPNMRYLETYKCEKLAFFPCDEEGVWTNESE